MVGLLVVQFVLPFARLQLDQHHDGYMFKAALDVARGQVLYRDSFMQYGPVPTWVHALGIEFFGEHILSVRLVTAVAYGAAGAMLFLAWRRFMPAAWSLVSVGLWFAFADFFRADRSMLPWSSAVLLVFQAAAMWARSVGIDQEGRGRAFAWNVAAGVAAAGALLCRLPSGMALFLMLLVPAAAARGRARTVPALLLGFLGVMGLFVAWAAGVDALDAVIEQTIVWPYKWASPNSGTAYWGNLLKQIVVYAAVVMAVVGIAGRLSARRDRKAPTWTVEAVRGLALGLVLHWAFNTEWKLWLIGTAVGLLGLAGLRRAVVERELTSFDAAALLAVGGLAQVFPSPDVTHLWWSVGPGIGVVLAAVWRVRGRWGFRAPLAFVVAAAIAVAFPLLRHGVAKVTDDEWTAIRDDSDITRGMLVRPEALANFVPFFLVLDPVDDREPIMNIGRNSFWATFTTTSNFDAYTVDWGPGRVYTPERLRYLEQVRPIVTTTDRENLPLFLETLDYEIAVDMVIDEWGAYHYYLLVPTERAEELRGNRWSRQAAK